MELTCALASLPTLDTPLVALVLADDDTLPAGATDLDAHLGGALARAIERGHARASKAGTHVVSGAADGPHNVVLVGLGTSPDDLAERVRSAGAAIAAAATSLDASSVAIVPPAGGAEAAAQLLEGFVLGGYRYEPYKSQSSTDGDDDAETPTASPTAVQLLTDDEAIQQAAQEAIALAQATNWARDLANTPGNDMTPELLAAAAQQLAAEHDGLSATVLDETQIQDAGLGLLWAVGKGSENAPRLIVLEWNPDGAAEADADRLCFVGKAVTFDTGGISIKPSAGMSDMRLDKSGGCAVLGAMRAIAELGIQRRILAVVPAAENMPGGRAYKPGDVVTAFDGTTVEITNTDAEGRLVLGDAISWARELGCSQIVELSTLTGMTMIFFGGEFAGCYALEDEPLTDAALAASRSTGDRAWLLPQDEAYRKSLKSEIADMVNSGPRAGGGIYAGMFLRHFAKDTPFVHFDIAGSAMLDKPRRYFRSKGASGWGVRLLTRLASNI